MSQISFPHDWLNRFTDPYAVLGVSVSADDRRILKRYRVVAKLLHPDSYGASGSAEGDLASQLFARLVSPAYQQLKLDKGRADHLAILRFRVRRMSRDEVPSPQSAAARQLMVTPPESVEIIYEQAIAELAESQYQPLGNFAQITEQLGELNLIYLRLKMGEPLMREKRTGIIPSAEAKPIQVTPVREEEKPTINYDVRHYQRAQEYVKKNNWSSAVQELRDAIRLEPSKSEYHALLAKAYLMQNLTGMATVHFRQALKLNPKDPLALQYAKQLKINPDNPTITPKNGRTNDQQGGFFGGLFAKKR